MSTPDPGRAPGQNGWGFLLLSAAALLAVTLSPFSIAVGEDVWVWALWLDVAITALAATLVWVRGGFGCLEQFVPLVATVAVVATTAARPDVVGPWIPVSQGVALLAVIVGTRLRSGKRTAGRN